MMDRIQAEREARAYIVTGAWEKAVDLYRELLETKGADPNIYNLIGDVYAKVDNLEDAIPEYLSAIDVYEAEGLFENGIAVCKKILRLSPESGDVYFRLASFYAEIGLLSEAKESLINYMSCSEDNTIAKENPQKYKKLMILLSSDERLKPDVKAAYVKIGQQERELDALFGIASSEPNQSLESKSIPKSEETSKDAVTEETVPPSDEPEKQLAIEGEISIGQTKQATHGPLEVESVSSDSGQEPAAESLFQQEAEAKEVAKNVRLPRDEEEVQLFLHAIEEVKASNSSGGSKDHYEIGLQYKQLGFYDAAVREFQLSSTAGQKRLESLKEVGNCFLEKNQADIAVSAFKRAIEESTKGGKDYIVLRYGIGKAYEQLGDKEKAIGAFEDICLHDIGYLDVKERLVRLRGE